MTTRKRNEWLEPELSEEEDQGYDSEAAEQSRINALDRRAPKRRKTSDSEEEDDLQDNDSDGEIFNGLHDAESDDETDDIAPLPALSNASSAQSHKPNADNRDYNSPSPTNKKTKPKELGAKSVKSANRKASKTGVIYLSSIPPFMKPSTVRNLLTPFGTVGRVFLTPEDPESHKRRVRSGGNKKKSFTDGWVEFLRKKDAKLVAETLNAQLIGGKKGGFYHDDLWNIKYVGLKWEQLTEQIRREGAERQARLRTEIARSTRENRVYLEGVERAKMLEGMQAKRMEKEGKRGEDAGDKKAVEGAERQKLNGSERIRRRFKQNEVKVKTWKEGSQLDQPESVTRVLSKIF